jgi:hypothetical protein
MNEISFNCSKNESEAINKIADRYIQMMHLHSSKKIDRTALIMDITACHCNGCNLNLHGLLTADEFNLGHDVGGIRQYIDRSTGKMTNCFLPRFSS